MRSQIAITALTLASVLVSFTAQAADKVIHIGYQKYGKLVLLKGKGGLEQRLEPLGYKVAGPNSPPARRCWKPSMSEQSISATPAKRRPSSPRPPARHSSTSRTSLLPRKARRSWCRRTARLQAVS